VSYEAKPFSQLGDELGQLVDEKQRQYGDAVTRVSAMLSVLYPTGVPLRAVHDALLIVRVCDKLCRISQRGSDGKDLGGESPWQDIAGYGLLGYENDRKNAP
jgi:hypothetical protein